MSPGSAWTSCSALTAIRHAGRPPSVTARTGAAPAARRARATPPSCCWASRSPSGRSGGRGEPSGDGRLVAVGVVGRLALDAGLGVVGAVEAAADLRHPFVAVAVAQQAVAGRLQRQVGRWCARSRPAPPAASRCGRAARRRGRPARPLSRVRRQAARRSAVLVRRQGQEGGDEHRQRGGNSAAEREARDARPPRGPTGAAPGAIRRASLDGVGSSSRARSAQAKSWACSGTRSSRRAALSLPARRAVTSSPPRSRPAPACWRRGRG